MELSHTFKKVFLLEFTKQLIKYSEKRDMLRLQGIVESKERAERISPVQPKPQFTKEVEMRKEEPIPQRIPPKRFVKPAPSLYIPEPKLPEHLEYLKPIPSSGVEIDLWKLNPLIKDPAVKIIQVNPDEQTIVIGAMGTKPTDIILNKEDIDRVISRFSELSKIPVEEGIYRVVVGNLILAAIVSEVAGSRFLIKKIFPIPQGLSPNSPRVVR